MKNPFRLHLDHWMEKLATTTLFSGPWGQKQSLAEVVSSCPVSIYLFYFFVKYGTAVQRKRWRKGNINFNNSFFDYPRSEAEKRKRRRFLFVQSTRDKWQPKRYGIHCAFFISELETIFSLHHIFLHYLSAVSAFDVIENNILVTTLPNARSRWNLEWIFQNLNANYFTKKNRKIRVVFASPLQR